MLYNVKCEPATAGSPHIRDSRKCRAVASLKAGRILFMADHPLSSDDDLPPIIRLFPDLADEAGISACSGSMTCECESCTDERAVRVARGVRHRRQPWQSKRAA